MSREVQFTDASVSLFGPITTFLSTSKRSQARLRASLRQWSPPHHTDHTVCLVTWSSGYTVGSYSSAPSYGGHVQLSHSSTMAPASTQLNSIDIQQFRQQGGTKTSRMIATSPVISSAKRLAEIRTSAAVAPQSRPAAPSKPEPEKYPESALLIQGAHNKRRLKSSDVVQMQGGDQRRIRLMQGGSQRRRCAAAGDFNNERRRRCDLWEFGHPFTHQRSAHLRDLQRWPTRSGSDHGDSHQQTHRLPSSRESLRQ